MKLKENIVIEIIDDKYTIYDPIEDKLLTLNLSASLILDMLIKGKKKDEILKTYMEIYEIDEEKAKEDIENLIENLKKEGILEDV
jgi:hypothetical protein